MRKRTGGASRATRTDVHNFFPIRDLQSFSAAHRELNKRRSGSGETDGDADDGAKPPWGGGEKTGQSGLHVQAAGLGGLLQWAWKDAGRGRERWFKKLLPRPDWKLPSCVSLRMQLS